MLPRRAAGVFWLRKVLDFPNILQRQSPGSENNREIAIPVHPVSSSSQELHGFGKPATDVHKARTSRCR